MKLKLLYLLLSILAFSSLQVQAQLSDLHYLPPLKQISGAFVQQSIYLSTPVTTPFEVKMYVGTSTVASNTFTLSKTQGVEHALVNGDNGITLLAAGNTGIVQSTAGLRFESVNGEQFYINWRGRSTHQASSLTSKGRVALGKAFKWGGVPNRGTNYSILNTSVGFMASEDNTEIKVFDYNPACTFRLGSNATGITADELTINLNAGQSFVLEATISGANSPNIDGWLGASIISNKDIVVNIGEMHFQATTIGNQDAAIDQIIPENTVGRDYVFVRGNGINSTEFPVIIATENNTQIFVNGSSFPIATINNGDYYSIPSTYYSQNSTTASTPGANMYVRTSLPAYAFQALAGSSGTETGDINFIAPVNCLLSNTIDNISQINKVTSSLTINGGVTIIASSLIQSSDIIVKYGSQTVTEATLNDARKSIAGTSDWVTYFIPGLTGDVSVEANGPIAVGFFGFSGAAGASGYFSGFETIPNVLVQLEGDGCLPSTTLVSTAGFTSYAWYKDGNLIPDAQERFYVPTEPGSYNVVVTTGTCIYESASQVIADCNPEIVLSTSANKSSAQPSENITFRVKSKFLGFGKAEELKISISIPQGLIFQSSSISYGSITGSGNNYVWNIGTLYNGQEPILDVVTQVDPSLANSKEVTFMVSNTQLGIDANKVLDDPTETVLLYLKPLPALGKLRAMNRNVRDGSFDLKDPTSNSTGSFTYSSNNPSVATVSGSKVTLTGVGTAVIKVQQASDENFDLAFSEAELIVNESVAVLTNTGEISSSKNNLTSLTGSLKDYQGLTQHGGKQVAKSPEVSDVNMVLWLDSDHSSSYNRKNNTWYDITPESNHGQLVNKIGFSNLNARSFLFNGSSNYIAFEEGFPSTDFLTIEAWVYPTSLLPDYSTILNHNNWSPGMVHFQFQKNKLQLGINSATSVFSTYTFTPDQWYYLVVVYSKTNQSVKFYVNGVMTNEASTGSGSPSIIQSPFSIGSWNGTSRFLKGNMALFKMYTRALTLEEVLANYNMDKSRYK